MLVATSAKPASSLQFVSKVMGVLSHLKSIMEKNYSFRIVFS
jgi:hypothetical protein